MRKMCVMSVAVFMSYICDAGAQRTWSLRQCVDHAVEHNLTVKQYENMVRQRQISLSTSENSRLPNLTASANESMSFGRGLTSNNTYANRNTQSTNFDLSTNVPLFTSGRITNEIKLGRLDLEASMADLDKVKDNIELQVIRAYLDAIYQKDMVKVAEEQVRLSTLQVKRVQMLYDNDMRSGADLAQIKSAKASDESSLTQQRNAYMLALLELSQLLELPTPDGMDLVTPSTDVSELSDIPLPEVVYSEAVGMKPQVMAEQMRLKSAEKGVKVARSSYFPSLYFSAGMGSSYYKTSGYDTPSFGSQMKDNFNRYMALSFSVPIFNRFATRNAVRTAKVQVNNQEIQLEETRKALYKEIQQAYYNALASKRQCESAEMSLASANESFELTRNRYENGKANATDFQEAKMSLMKAETTLLQSKYTFLFRREIINFYRRTR